MSVFTLTEPVYCLLVSKITHLWSVWVIPLSLQTPQGTISHRSPRPPDPSLLSSCPHTTAACCECPLLTILCPPMRKKHVSLHFPAIQAQRFPTVHSCTSLTHLHWRSRTPPHASSFDCNIYNKLQHFHSLEHFLNLLSFCFPATVISLAQINS